MDMKNILTLLFSLFWLMQVNAQNPKIDRLEMLFSQKHYKKVYRKSNRLLDNPEYDFSMMPSYYKSLSMFQLSQNKFWLTRHKSALKQAEELFLKVKYSENGTKILNAHMYEIAWLKSDLTSWASDLKRMGETEQFSEVQEIIQHVFGDFDLAIIPDENIEEGNNSHDEEGDNHLDSDVRSKIVRTSKKHIGTPYVWAGTSPSGFDCSGFTSYIMKGVGEDIPRRSSDQYDQSIKLKKREVKKGDLVFFNNGSGVSHVGIIVSEKGSPLTMIHSSSSKGIIITNIEESSYWSARLHGYGTFLK